MLVLPEGFAEQPPRAAPFHRAADFFARDHAKFGRRAVGQPVPIGDEAALREPFALLPDASEIAALREPRGAAQSLAIGGSARMAGLDWRQAFAALTAAVAQRGAAALGGFAGKKPVLPLAAHLLRLILAFHKLCLFAPPAPNEQRSITIIR